MKNPSPMQIRLTQIKRTIFTTILLFGALVGIQAQTSYTFAACGASGRLGPTQTQANTAYSSTNLNGLVTVSSGVQSWTVPSTGSYRVRVSGASGGSSIYGAGGSGIIIQSDVTFTVGQVINIAVGQKGASNGGTSDFYCGASGGGGSFVYTGAIGGTGLILSAGGGGGALSAAGGAISSNVSNASYSTSGYSIIDGGSYISLGGVNGNGGGFSNRSLLSGGPGAGWFSDYVPTYGSPNVTLGGTRFNGGILTNTGVNGGFGGGGASGDASANSYVWSGGGGGYSGGGAGHNGGNSDGQVGGGGGSFLSGTNQTNVGFNANNDGYVIITQLSGVTISQTASVTCNGLSNAALSASVTGGTAPFTYTWSTGSNATSISGLSAGTYTCRATDGAAVTYSATYVITQPSPVTAITSTQTNLTCFGASNGVLGLTPGGGTAPYTYSWSPSGGTSAVASGLSAGAYTCIVKDANNCITAQIATITQPASTLGVIGFATNPVVCAGQTSILLGGGALTYAWSNGVINGVTFAPSSSNVYTVTGTDVSGCTATATVAITVNSLPPVSISGPSVICTGNSATLTVTGANTYTWNTTANTNTIGISPLVTTSYSVGGTNASGCINSSVKTITVINTSPAITASASSPSVCIGGSTTLFGGGAATYSWSGGVTNNVAFAPSISGVYTVTGYNACGSGTNTILITVNSLPNITANSSATAVCIGGSATLSGVGGVSYIWTGGVTNNNSFLPSVTTTYTVTGTDANGCQNTATKTILVNPLPLITANVTSSIVCLGNTTTLFGGGGVSYTWSGGVTNNTPFAPSTTASYIVTGTDANGCQNTASKTVTVINVPALTAIATNPSVCQGGSTTLSSTGANTYTWTGGVTNNVPFVPSATTTYSVYGTNSCGTTSNVVTVTVNPLPVVTANASSSVACFGTAITLFGGGASTYTWTGGITNNVSFVPTISATYSVTGTDANGCKNTASKTLTVLSLPVVTASASSSAFCFGNSTILNGGGASSYVWSGGVVNNTAFTPSVTTTYTVTGTGTNGCQNTAIKTVTVYQLPVVIANVSSSVICSSNSTSFYGSGANTYTWSGGITNGSIQFPSATVSYSVSGTNTLTGCTSTNIAVATVTVNPLPTVTISVSNPSVCLGQSVSLTAGGANTYTWSTGSTSNSITFIPNTSVSYSVIGKNTLTGCSNIALQTVIVNPRPFVTASVNIPAICSGASVIFSGQGASTYTWTGGVVDGAPFFPSGSGTYFVSGTNTLTGCTSTNSASQFVTVNQAPTLFITVTNSALCEGSSVTINTQGANTYTWSDGISNGVPFTPTVTATYTVTGLNTSSGCYSTTTQVIVVNPRPIVLGTATPSAVCKGSTAQLIGSGADTYSWTGGVINAVSFTPAITASYSVTGTNTLTGCSSTNIAVQTVVVNQLPVVSPSVSANAACLGKTITFFGLGADTFTWTNGPTNGVPFTVLQSDTFYVSGTNTITGCTSTNVAMQTITALSLTPLSVISASAIVCSGETTTLTAVGVGSHTWSTGQIGHNIAITPSVSTDYTVSVYGAFGCINSVTITQNVSDCTGLTSVKGETDSYLSVYPNPSSGNFTIKSSGNIDLMLINSLGQTLKTLVLDGTNEQNLTVTDLPAGIYYITGEQNKTVFRQKIIIAR